MKTTFRLTILKSKIVQFARTICFTTTTTTTTTITTTTTTTTITTITTTIITTTNTQNIVKCSHCFKKLFNQS